MTNLFAYTAVEGSYPGFVSINRKADGSVSITVREAPTVRDGSYICGFKADKGKPGRCTPGDSCCNNYCNMAPEKGNMQDHPAPCVQTFEGKSASFSIPAVEWERMQAPQ